METESCIGEKGPMVTLVELLRCDLKNVKIEKLVIQSSHAGQRKKGEAFTTYSLVAIYDKFLLCLFLYSSLFRFLDFRFFSI